MDDETRRRLGVAIRECANLNNIELFGSVALSIDDTAQGWLDAGDRNRVWHLLWRLDEMGLQITSKTDDPGAYKKPLTGPRGKLP